MDFMLKLLVGFTVDWLDFLVGITISDGESCFIAANTFVEASSTLVVEAYLIASWPQSYDFFRSPRKVSTPTLLSILRSRYM
jgi:hypothetical protein